jgi:2-aminoadipate transaminase
MNLWVRLPDLLDASELAVRAERENVSYLPGRYFSVSRPHIHGLRLSFASLAPDLIRAGMAVLGKIFRAELERAQGAHRDEPAPAVV